MTREKGIATAYGVAATWYVGEQGRTIYAQLGDKPSPADPFLGLMEDRGAGPPCSRCYECAVGEGLRKAQGPPSGGPASQPPKRI